MNMFNPDGKIVCEVSLTNESKDNIAAFIEENFRDIYVGKQETWKKFLNKVRDNFPAQSLDMLKDALHNPEAEYAVLIHNTPEKEGIEKEQRPSAVDSYSYYVGKA